MNNDFPEGGFLPPHKIRKKPDCDRKPILPDPCEIRNPKIRNFFSTDAPCINDEPETICPTDIVVTRRHREVVTIPVEKIPIVDPTPTPAFNDEPLDLYGNSQLVIHCPSSDEDPNYFLGCNDVNYPDSAGNYPTIGNTLTILNDTFFASTKEEADQLAQEEADKLVCTSVECLWGNPELVGNCADILSQDDLTFLAEHGFGPDELILGGPITVPENTFLSNVSLEDATAKAQDYLTSLLYEACFLCNCELEKPCAQGEEPAEGFSIERCSMQGRFDETSLAELKAKAQEFLDSFDCFGLPSFNDHNTSGIEAFKSTLLLTPKTLDSSS